LVENGSEKYRIISGIWTKMIQVIMLQHTEETIRLTNILFSSDPNLSNQIMLYIDNIPNNDKTMLKKTCLKIRFSLKISAVYRVD
jgi:hypothetical protein